MSLLNQGRSGRDRDMHEITNGPATDTSINFHMLPADSDGATPAMTFLTGQSSRGDPRPDNLIQTWFLPIAASRQIMG